MNEDSKSTLDQRIPSDGATTFGPARDDKSMFSASRFPASQLSSSAGSPFAGSSPESEQTQSAVINVLRRASLRLADLTSADEGITSGTTKVELSEEDGDSEIVNLRAVRRASIDPPRPAKDGFEWVWFPEGYWAERWDSSQSHIQELRKKKSTRGPTKPRKASVVQLKDKPDKSDKIEDNKDDSDTLPHSTVKILSEHETTHMSITEDSRVQQDDTIAFQKSLESRLTAFPIRSLAGSQKRNKTNLTLAMPTPRRMSDTPKFTVDHVCMAPSY